MPQHSRHLTPLQASSATSMPQHSQHLTPLQASNTAPMPQHSRHPSLQASSAAPMPKLSRQTGANSALAVVQRSADDPQPIVKRHFFSLEAPAAEGDAVWLCFCGVPPHKKGDTPLQCLPSGIVYSFLIYISVKSFSLSGTSPLNSSRNKIITGSYPCILASCPIRK